MPKKADRRSKMVRLHGGNATNSDQFFTSLPEGGIAYESTHMQKYIMRSETASDFLDMPVSTFDEAIAPFLDCIVMGEDNYYMTEDVMFVVKLFFKRPETADILPFPS